MKNLLALMVAALLISLWSCKKDPVDNGKVIAEASISSQGGTLSSGEVVFTIPKGSVSSTTLVKIIEIDTIYGGASQFSKTFQLEGIPSNYKGELQVKIKYSKPLVGKSYVTCYFTSSARSLEIQTISGKHFEAKDSAGFLVSSIYFGDGNDPLLKSAGGIAFTDEKLGFSATSGMGSTQESEIDNLIMFDVIYPTGIPTDLPLKVAKHLVKVAKIFSGYGFSYKARDNTELFPIYIVNNPGATVAGFFSRGIPWTIDGSYIQLNYPLCSTSEEELRSTIGHEFFHFIHSCYGLDDNDSWWYQEALCTFAEELLQENPAPFYSSQFLVFYNAPFNGMEAGKNWIDPNTGKASIQQHGYGMGALIKEFYHNSESTRKSTLPDLVTKVATDKMMPIEALKSTFSDFTFIWKDYFNKFYEGQLPYIKPSTTREEVVLDPNLTRIWNIGSTADSVKKFTDQMPDLSANIYRIHLNRDFDSTEILTLNALATAGITDIEMRVYQYKKANGAGAPVLIGLSPQTEAHEIIIPRLDQIKQTCTSLLVVITNSRADKPYMGNSTVNLNLKFGKESVKYINSFSWSTETFLMYNQDYSASVGMSISGDKFRISSDKITINNTRRDVMLSIPKITADGISRTFSVNISVGNLAYNPPQLFVPTLIKGEVQGRGAAILDNSGSWSFPMTVTKTDNVVQSAFLVHFNAGGYPYGIIIINIWILQE